MGWTEVFQARLPHIYLVYGLTFFILGTAVVLEVARATPTRLARAMWPLAVFGIAHGTYEWIEMFSMTGLETYGARPSLGLLLLRLTILAISFISLVAFGVQMRLASGRLRHPDLWAGLVLLLLYGLGVIALGRWLDWERDSWFAASDALARYSLAIPGAILTSWVLLIQRRAFLRLKQVTFANDLLWASVAFFLYGAVGQLFVKSNALFPSNILNYSAFQDWFGIPVQLFRAALAVVIAFFIIRALRAFEFDRQQSLIMARRRIDEEVERRHAQRREFLRRIVTAQEEERTRIARELHDELSQMLTGLAIGLRGARTSIHNPELIRQQLIKLQEMATLALDGMSYLIADLRPALLDDMGLTAALRRHVDRFAGMTDVKATLTVEKGCGRLPGELETILFRTTQEALNNVARHSKAKHVSVDLRCDDNMITLHITDDGLGFDATEVLEGGAQPGWGLIGIQERVSLAEGSVSIDAARGHGTSLLIQIPLVTGDDDVLDQTHAGG